MARDWLRGLFGDRSREAKPQSKLQPDADLQLPALPWIEAESNPWRVRLPDVSPITSGMVSASSDPQMAMNAASFSNEPPRLCRSGDGVHSIGRRAARCRLDGDIYDGVLFNPGRMEEKWALYFHGGRVICVRSWQRRVQIAADTRRADGALEIVRIHGSCSTTPSRRR